MFMVPRQLHVALLALALMVVAVTPAVGYVIFLKDGNQIIIRDKYRVEGDQALFELQSGTTSSIPMADIDVEKTEAKNLVALRGVQVIEGFEAIDLANAPIPPPPPDTISDLLRQTGETGTLRVPESRRRLSSNVGATPAEAGLPRTPAGYYDLVRLPRRPYAQTDVGEVLLQYFQGQGVEILGVYEGSGEKQPFVELITTSEAAVFKALEESANALVQVRASHPDRVTGLEILMVSRIGESARGGQFQLTPELAELLASGSIAPRTFFVRYVEF